MAQDFFTLVTEIGSAKLANAVALGTQVNLSHIAVGDGNGNPITPVPSMTALVNEVHRAPLTNLSLDPENPSLILAEMVVPPEVGGFTVHEVGVFDSEGNLFAVASFPATYKPTFAEGSGREIAAILRIEVSSTAAITLKIDPTMVLASRKYVDDSITVVRAWCEDHINRKDDPHETLPAGGEPGQILTRRPDAGLAWMDMPKRIRGIRHVTYTESGTYTPASNVAIIEVRVSGAGGGAGADNQGHVKPDGEAGGDTSFIGGATSITAKGGGPGLNPLATGVIKIRSAWSGGTATGVESSYVVPAGGSLGGATNAARDAANYIRHGIDGQPGGLVVAVIAKPVSTYDVTIGAGGLSGTVMTGTEAAAGLNGSVVITEYLEE